MARIEATSDTAPVARKARSAGTASRWMREKAMSPPRILRPSRVRPSVSEREIEETPAIAATPSAMQARKMPKPGEPAAQLAQGEAQDQRQALRRAGRRGVALREPCIVAHLSRLRGVGLDMARSAAAPCGRSGGRGRGRG